MANDHNRNRKILGHTLAALLANATPSEIDRMLQLVITGMDDTNAEVTTRINSNTRELLQITFTLAGDNLWGVRESIGLIHEAISIHGNHKKCQFRTAVCDNTLNSDAAI